MVGRDCKKKTKKKCASHFTIASLFIIIYANHKIVSIVAAPTLHTSSCSILLLCWCHYYKQCIAHPFLSQMPTTILLFIFCHILWGTVLPLWKLTSPLDTFAKYRTWTSRLEVHTKTWSFVSVLGHQDPLEQTSSHVESRRRWGRSQLQNRHRAPSRRGRVNKSGPHRPKRNLHTHRVRLEQKEYPTKKLESFRSISVK